MNAAALHAQRLRRWLDEGDVLHPEAPGHLAFTDLMSVVFSAAGVPLPYRSEGAALAEALGQPDHLIFILADGLGWPVIQSWAPDDGLLRRKMFQTCRAVFPSATASALTTVATGLWPGRHGITGWWTHLPEDDLILEPLPWRPMGERSHAEIEPEAVFQTDSRFSLIPRDVLTVTPEGLAESIYSGWSAAGTPVAGYTNWTQAVELITERIRSAKGPTFTWWYLPEFDRHGHLCGVSHKKTGRIVRRLDQVLSQLHDNLKGRARMLLTADHGHVDAHPEGDHVVGPDDPLLRHMAAMPTGEPVCPHFHLKAGHREAFISEFNARFGRWFTLIPVDMLVDLGIYGPTVSPEVRARLGDVVALSLDAMTWRVHVGERPPNPLKGLHGGLTPGEMQIPVVLF